MYILLLFKTLNKLKKLQEQACEQQNRYIYFQS